MNFINPIEILEVSKYELSAIDGTLIKKAKKRVLADIELSDSGHYNYADTEYTKSDIERVIDFLDDPDKLEFYYFLAHHEKLNDFLKVGDPWFIYEFEKSSFYKLDGFISFISSFYAISFNKIITKFYKNNLTTDLKKVLDIPELFTIADRKIAYGGIEKTIEKQIFDLDEITKAIREDTTSETRVTITKKAQHIISIFGKDKLTLLPFHFQSLKNQIAQSIRNLSVQIHNHFSLTELALGIISHALTIGVDGLTAEKLREDHKKISDLYFEALDKEKYDPYFKKYAVVVEHLLNLKKSLNAKSLKPAQLVLEVNHPELKGLNQSPDALSEIRDQIAVILRSISVDLWNDFNDIQSATTVIKIAVGIKTSEDTKQNIIKAQQDLQALFVKHRHELYCFFCDKNAPMESQAHKTTIYKETFRQYKRVQYSYKEISIPRCSSCSEIHTKGSNTKVLYTVVVGALGIVLGYIADEHFIIGGIIGTIGGLLLGGNQSDEKIKENKIKSVSAVSQFPPITELLRIGWSFNKPSA